LTDIYQFTNTKVQEILQVCRQQVSGLYKAAEAVSMLDLLFSFATTLTLSGDKKYARPQVASTAQNTLAIQQGRHPILETLSAGPVVPNDTFHNDEQNVAMISGANMAGKSTYIKQVALCVVLAHVGAHVPAEFFASPPIDRIFTRYVRLQVQTQFSFINTCADRRTSTVDDLANNESSFLTEMKEVAQITRGLSEHPPSSTQSKSRTRALVVVDELGRGTSPTDGVSIAWAVAESLMQHDAFVLFVTHFDQLNHMQSIYPKIRNCHLSTTATTCGRLQYRYALKSGACTQLSYGLSAAEVSGIPDSMLSIARDVSTKVAADKREQEKRRQNMSKKSGNNWIALRLVRKLRAIKGAVLATDESALRGHLKALRAEFVGDTER
jgi:DNA mismatch repair protein MSH4